MKARLSNIQINATNLELDDKIWEALKTPLTHRKGYKLNSNVVKLPAYFYRFIGIKEDEEAYYDEILRLHKELMFLGPLYLNVSNGFTKDIGVKIQSVLCNIKEGSLTNDIGFLMQKVDQNSLLKGFNNLYFGEQVKNNLKVVLEYYKNIAKGEVKLNEILAYLIYWANFYIPNLTVNYDYEELNPKVIYYGKVYEEESLFLILLWTLGIDVLYFCTEDDEVFKKVDPNNTFSREVIYSKRCSIKELPKTFTERIGTVAYGAKEELDRILYNDKGNFYRPWQFSDYKVKPITLKTTFEEIFIWMKEPGSMRQGWKVENDTVYIPNIFGKIIGTKENGEDYFRLIDNIINEKNTIFVDKLPIIDYTHLEYSKFNEVYPKDSLYFDVNKMINSSWWRYGELRMGMQRALGEAIKELCLNPVIYNKQNEKARDFQVEIFSVLINSIDKKFQELLQSFDYTEAIPKIVIYNNEQNGNVSMEDCVLLTLLNYMGIDIFVFNPSGYSDIENYIYEDLYDTHTLDKMRFNLGFRKPKEKKKGIFQRIFGF
ncbi:YceG family protein [Hathewaya histolytica]|uniref:YceG family protein n=1 Tax=Hathewaya histolytica TaxID=1498 RepID=UPI003B66F95F